MKNKNARTSPVAVAAGPAAAAVLPGPPQQRQRRPDRGQQQQQRLPLVVRVQVEGREADGGVRQCVTDVGAEDRGWGHAGEIFLIMVYLSYFFFVLATFCTWVLEGTAAVPICRL